MYFGCLLVLPRMAQWVVLFPTLQLHIMSIWQAWEWAKSFLSVLKGFYPAGCLPAIMCRAESVACGLPTTTCCSDSVSDVQCRIRWTPVVQSFPKRHVHSCFKTAMLIMIRKGILNVQVMHDFYEIQFEIKTHKFRCLGVEVFIWMKQVMFYYGQWWSCQ